MEIYIKNIFTNLINNNKFNLKNTFPKFKYKYVNLINLYKANNNYVNLINLVKANPIYLAPILPILFN